MQTCMDLHRLAQTCTDLHRLAKTYMTIGKTGTVIFDLEMVGVGLWVNSIGFFGKRETTTTTTTMTTQQNPRSLCLRCAGLIKKIK